MKRFLIGGVAVAALLGAAAWGAWQWGAGRLSDAIDAEAARLAEQGVVLGWSARRIEGFPLNYAVVLERPHLRDANGEWAFEAARSRTVAALPWPSTARTTVSSQATLTAAVAPGEVRRIEVISRDLSVETALDGRRPATFAAEALALRPVGADGGTDAQFELGFEGLSLTVATEPGGEARFDLAADSLTSVAETSDGSGGVMRPVTRTTDVRVEGRARGWQAGDAAAFLTEGEAFLSLRAGRTVSTEGLVNGEAGPGRLEARLQDGRLRYEADAEWARYEIAQGPGGPGGVIAVGAAEALFEAPLRAGPGQPFAMRISVPTLEADEALWSLIDPQTTLARGPLSLEADITGAVALLVNAGDPLPGGEAPLRIETVDIRALRLAGMGAAADVSGALTLRPGAPAPDGSLTVRLEGWEPLLQALVRLGVVGLDQAGLFALVAQQYNRQGAPAGVFDADVVLRDGVATVNGQPLR
ncbi:MAG: DUF2125 domain-containing protein [Rubrimonas sp.]